MHEYMSLRSDRLLARVAMPGRGLHAQHRFDWTGFVPEVIIGGRDIVGTQEQFDPARWTSYGAGFCAEFVWPSAVAEPVDGWFPKIGVGWLRSKSGETEWNIRGEYEIAPSEMLWERISLDEHRFSFTLEPRGGYGCTLERRLRVTHDALINAAVLTNTGTRPIRGATEYNHNFLTLNNRPIDEGFHLSLPVIREWPGVPAELARVGDGITPKSYIVNPFFFASDEVNARPGAVWSLAHRDEKIRVEESLDTAPCRVAVWGIEHVISAEVFVPIDLEPGQSMTWTRTWRFPEQ